MIRDRTACEHLMTQYCHLVDDGRAPEIFGLSTDDGIWDCPGATIIGADEVASVATFLLFDDVSFMTGSAVMVDGGYRSI